LALAVTLAVVLPVFAGGLTHGLIHLLCVNLILIIRESIPSRCAAGSTHAPTSAQAYEPLVTPSPDPDHHAA